MAGARALIAPTLYVEPFGGVAVEAMLAGTPVIAPDFGAFTETVENRVTGQRFTTMQEALDALDICDRLNHEAIRAHAIERYSLEAVAPQFRTWFDRLDTLHGEGWYQLRDGGAATVSRKVTA
jgi:glycosyltransferase involved in cell wall biosynthesis